MSGFIPKRTHDSAGEDWKPRDKGTTDSHHGRLPLWSSREPCSDRIQDGGASDFLLYQMEFKSQFSCKSFLRKSTGATLVVQWVKNPPYNARDTGLISVPGRSHMTQSN